MSDGIASRTRSGPSQVWASCSKKPFEDDRHELYTFNNFPINHDAIRAIAVIGNQMVTYSTTALHSPILCGKSHGEAARVRSDIIWQVKAWHLLRVPDSGPMKSWRRWALAEWVKSIEPRTRGWIGP